MTREEIASVVLKSNSNDFILELSTGVGKTRIALDKLNQWFKNEENYKILICVPKKVLQSNWIAEIKKWSYEYLLEHITFTCYASFHKHCGNWDSVIFDEAHHISDRCKSFLPQYKVKHTILLSATLKKDFKRWVRYRYKDIHHVFIATKEAINSDILPEPKIVLIPMQLDNTVSYCKYEVKAKKGGSKIPINVMYKEKWRYRKYNGAYNLICTQRQYYNEISGLIDWYKQKANGSTIMRNMWLHKCNDRLKWLSDQKIITIKSILKQLRNYRLLTFCSTIEQSEKLETPCVNSKIGIENLTLFNNKKIKHLCAVGILDEGVNLANCRIGLFQMINSSVRLIVQRSGRIYRHSKPVLIFPYYKNTREEEIVNNIIEDYDKNSIITIYSIDELSIIINNK